MKYAFELDIDCILMNNYHGSINIDCEIDTNWTIAVFLDDTAQPC